MNEGALGAGQKGYWVFHAPVGCKFKTDRIHGRLFEPNDQIQKNLVEGGRPAA
ncbi:MAG: hypothetical protein ACI9IV_000858 [Paracoccaceae bacterium]|jgi:hypothetical protein|tara:strand:+ start:135 stop:293 length:159 start_codon:yes stop_codon:yes gene_type:complete